MILWRGRKAKEVREQGKGGGEGGRENWLMQGRREEEGPTGERGPQLPAGSVGVKTCGLDGAGRERGDSWASC